jgi:hypothetical protein
VKARKNFVVPMKIGTSGVAVAPISGTFSAEMH